MFTMLDKLVRSMTLGRLTLLAPNGLPAEELWQLAPRSFTSLSGLRVGLLHNSKAGGDVILRELGEQLMTVHHVKSVSWWAKRSPSEPAPFVEDIERDCDVVLTAVGD